MARRGRPPCRKKAERDRRIRRRYRELRPLARSEGDALLQIAEAEGVSERTARRAVDSARPPVVDPETVLAWMEAQAPAKQLRRMEAALATFGRLAG